MNCKWHTRLHALHDGELGASERSAAEAHVAVCAECAAELGRMRRTARFLKAATMPALSGGVLTRLRGRLQMELENGRRTARLAGWLMAAAAAVMLCCSAALSMMRLPRGSSQQATGSRADGNGDDALSTNRLPRGTTRQIVASGTLATEKSSDDSMLVLMNAVKPDTEVAAAAETDDPLTQAVAPLDSGVDGRE